MKTAAAFTYGPTPPESPGNFPSLLETTDPRYRRPFAITSDTRVHVVVVGSAETSPGDSSTDPAWKPPDRSLDGDEKSSTPNPRSATHAAGPSAARTYGPATMACLVPFPSPAWFPPVPNEPSSLPSSGSARTTSGNEHRSESCESKTKHKASIKLPILPYKKETHRSSPLAAHVAPPGGHVVASHALAVECTRRGGP